jgi:hypothetical protein
MGKAAWIRACAAGIAGVAAVWGVSALRRDPPPEKPRLSAETWARKAEAACKVAATSIALRGSPIDIVDLDRVVVRTRADVGRAFATIRRLEEPAGGKAKVSAARAAMASVERDGAALAHATEDADRPALRRLAPQLRAHVQELQDAAVAADIQECAPPGLATLAADAVLAPVFAQDFAAFNRAYGERLERVLGARPKTTTQLADKMRRATEVLGDVTAQFDDLAVPKRASFEARAYAGELAAVRRVTRRLARAALASDRLFTPRQAALAREFARRSRHLGKLAVRTIDAAGASPIGDPEPEPTVAPSEQPS